MKPLHTLFGSTATLACLALSISPAASHAQTTPVATDFTHYTGTSFKAHWESLGDGQTPLLSVFTPSGETVSVSEDFSGIAHTDGKINATSPNYPDGWTVSVSAVGTTDVTEQDGKTHLVLDATDDYISVVPITGSGFSNYVVSASLTNADGISEENSSIVRVDVFDQSGQRIDGGTFYAIYFTMASSLNLFDDALYYTPANVGSVRISLIKDEGQVGDLVVNSISYDFIAPEYVLEDQETAGTEQEVDGLDPEREYFYYVRAQAAGNVSSPSNIVRVDPFLTPEATRPTDITSTSYTATWNHLPKAEKYIVHNYRYEVSGSDETVTTLSDDFAKATVGTTDSPVSVSDIDAYTSQAGWDGRNVVACEGMLGADAGRFPMNVSYLHSPSMNLSADGGKYEVHVRAIGTAGDQLAIYRVGHMVDTDGDGTDDALNIHRLTFGDDGVAEETYTMDDGAENVVLSFEENKLNRFFLDEISVTQTRHAGEVTKTLWDTVETTDAETTSYTFNALEPNAQYAYEIVGVRTGDYGDEEYSEPSSLIVVQLGDATPVESVRSVETVHVTGQNVRVSLNDDRPILLYSVDGKLVRSQSGRTGNNIVSLPLRGLYILRVGTETYKIFSK